MAAASLLDVDVRRVLEVVEELGAVSLPRRVIEAVLLPDEGVLHVRFEEPRGAELGEPIHPLIYVFRDAETGRITAIEIIDLDEIVRLAG